MEDTFENWDYSKTWVHGSPERLHALRPGASITQNRRLAEAFSHKPSFVSIGDDGSIRHDGARQGWLYVVDEPVTARDIRPYPPGERLPPGDEWLARRELKLKLVGSVEIPPEERLTPQEVECLLRRAGKTAEQLRSERLDLDQLRRLDESAQSGQQTPPRKNHYSERDRGQTGG